MWRHVARLGLMKLFNAVNRICLAVAVSSQASAAPLCLNKLKCQIMEPRVWSFAWRQRQPLTVVAVAELYYHQVLEAVQKPGSKPTGVVLNLDINWDGAVLDVVCVYKHPKCDEVRIPAKFRPPPRILLDSQAILRLELTM